MVCSIWTSHAQAAEQALQHISRRCALTIADDPSPSTGTAIPAREPAGSLALTESLLLPKTGRRRTRQGASRLPVQGAEFPSQTSSGTPKDQQQIYPRSWLTANLDPYRASQVEKQHQ